MEILYRYVITLPQSETRATISLRRAKIPAHIDPDKRA